MKPLKIGLTGGIGSGKTTICNVFKELGVPTYSADDESKDLLVKDIELIENVKSVFGKDIYTNNGDLNRALLSSIVFNDSEVLQKLNNIVHPAVRQHFLNWVSKQQSPYIIKEAAIMFESGAYKDLDYIVTVSAPENLRIERAMKRDNVKLEVIKARIDKQMTEEERISRSQYVIVNDDTQLVLPQILTLHQLFKTLPLNANR